MLFVYDVNFPVLRDYRLRPHDLKWSVPAGVTDDNVKRPPATVPALFADSFNNPLLVLSDCELIH